MQALIDGPELITRASWRGRIFETWGHCCAYCNAPAQSLDHVVPKAAGGLTVAANLVAACLACNRDKGHQEALSWWRPRPGWSALREQRLLEWVGNGHGVEPNHLCGAQQLPAACKAVVGPAS
jgi:5-methylcytosine-specific restriction endonuclease McrA